MVDENDLEHEKWIFEKSVREREVALKEKKFESRVKHKERAGSEWSNPLVIAIIAATIAAAGNALVAVVNSHLQRQLEDQRAEQSRILEMIKTGDADKAADNLEFLLNAGLITNQERAEKIRAFLATREPGSGPTLPTFFQHGTFPRGIVGADDALPVASLSSDTALVERKLKDSHNPIEQPTRNSREEVEKLEVGDTAHLSTWPT